MENRDLLKREYEYFTRNFDLLTKTYKDKYVVVKNQQVIGAYKTFDEAYMTTLVTEELGTFIIQKCGKDDSYSHMTFFTLSVF